MARKGVERLSVVIVSRVSTLQTARGGGGRQNIILLGNQGKCWKMVKQAPGSHNTRSSRGDTFLTFSHDYGGVILVYSIFCPYVSEF